MDVIVYSVSAVGVIAAVEFLARTHTISYVTRTFRAMQRQFKVFGASRVSDHWKEKVVPVYAGRVVKNALIFLFLVALAVAVIVGSLYGANLWAGQPKTVLDWILDWQLEVFYLFVVIVWVSLRNLFTKRGDYSGLDRLFCRLVLGGQAVRRTSLDVEFDTYSKKLPKQAQQPVFITGLARAGTTLLLEQLYATGEFVSLTYRDMPFVLAPNLGRVLKPFQKNYEMRERAHGDGMLVGGDSPEAFDEVFWRTVTADDYVQADRLKAHQATPEQIDEFKKYMSLAVYAHSPQVDKRYLSKNNNNCLRVESLAAGIPDGTFIIPFRNPVDHAQSLLNQHKKFIAEHKEDSFSLWYMNTLGHFEFGANQKCFELDGQPFTPQHTNKDSLNFWLEYWTYFYGYTNRLDTNRYILWDYDQFCAQPTDKLTKLFSRTGVASQPNQEHTGTIQPPPAKPVSPSVDQAVLDRARELHQALQKKAL